MGKFTEKAMEAYRQTMTDGRLPTIRGYFESVEAALIQFGIIGKVAGSSGGVANVTYADAENPRAEHVGSRPGLGTFECVMQPDGSIASRPRPQVQNQDVFASQVSIEGAGGCGGPGSGGLVRNDGPVGVGGGANPGSLFIRTPSGEEMDKIAAAMAVPGKIEPMKNDRHGNHAMLAKMDPAEPFFVLRGQDALAATLVKEWADRADAAGVPRDKIDNARQCARAMKNWPTKKIPD